MKRIVPDSVNKERIALRFIGSGESDLRWFILLHGRHAGGITVHSLRGDAFSYGVAVSPPLRQRGIAKAALLLLFQEMRKRGFSRARVCILKNNEASLSLHRSLGFSETEETEETVIMERKLLQSNEYAE